MDAARLHFAFVLRGGGPAGRDQEAVVLGTFAVGALDHRVIPGRPHHGRLEIIDHHPARHLGGLGLGKAITNVMFSKGESKQIGDAITKVAGKKANTKSTRQEVGDYIEAEKAAGRGGTKNKRGDFTFGELVGKVKDFFGGE